MITIDLSAGSRIYHGTIDVRKNILRDVAMYGANVIVYGKDEEKIYQAINDMVKEIPILDRCLVVDYEDRSDIPENGVNLKDIESKISSGDFIWETFYRTMPNRVIMGIVDKPIEVNLLLLHLWEGYSSILLGLSVADSVKSIEGAIQTLLDRMRESIEFKEAPLVLSRFILDNVHIGIRVD